MKFDQGVVTEAEIQLTEFFQDQLHRKFPEHKLFSYDAVSEDYSHEGKRYLWTFDPLEGVANFQAGIPIWGLSLALLENFWPVFGRQQRWQWLAAGGGGLAAGAALLVAHGRGMEPWLALASAGGGVGAWLLLMAWTRSWWR